MRYPVDQPYTISTHFGEPVAGSALGKHLGTDFALPANREVKACIGSTITRTGWSNAVGWFTEATGDDGMYYRYLHANKIVIAGGRVAEGQVIQLVGSTGSTSTGPHCHLDIRKPSAWDASFSNYVNPEVYLKQGGSMAVPVDLLRIVASEIEGFDSAKTHAGAHDNLLAGSWGNQPIENYIRHAWKVNPTKRGDLLNQIKKNKVNKGDVVNIPSSIAGWKPPQSYIDFWDGKDWNPFMYDLIKQQEFKDNLAKKYGNAECQAKLAEIKKIIG